MRAAIVERYGPPEVVRVVDVPDPLPRKGRVLVRVHATGVSSGDARIRGASFPPGFAVPSRLAFGLRRPRQPILGGTVAGEVVSVGDGVAGWAPGDRVSAMTGFRLGTHAELAVVRSKDLVRTPEAVADTDAAGVLFGGTTARHFLRKAAVGAGTTVLVVGASGALGTNAVQLAHALGAEVTGVCRGANADLVRRLGAKHVVDHTRADVTTLPERYDVVFDTVGVLRIATGKRLLRDGGRLVLAVGGLGEVLRSRGPVITGTSPEDPDDIAALLAMVADGSLEVVVDSTYALDDIVAAHARVDTHRKVGNVIVVP